MKILQITENFPPNHIGGAEISCEQISKQLMKRGHRIYILTNYSKEPRNKEFDIIYFKNKSFWGCNDFKSLSDDYSKIKKVVEKINPDVIHLHLFENYLHSAILLAKDFPTVYTAHNYTLLLPNYLNFDYFLKNPRNIISIKFLVYLKHFILRDKNYIKKLILDNIAYIKQVIVPSEFIQHKFEQFGYNNLKLIYNGVVNYHPSKIIINNPNEILYFGRFEKEKGIEYI